MQYTPTDFRTALELDMARHNMIERDLGARLGVRQQSISKWKARNFPPLYRVKDLIAVFGPESYVAKLDLPNKLAQTPRLRIAVPGTTPTQVQRAPRFTSVEHHAALRQAAAAVAAADTSTDIRSVLPEHLKPFAGAEGPLFNGKPLKTEYSSPTLAASIKPGVRHSALAATGVLTLAAARATCNAASTPTFVMAFVLEKGVLADEVIHPSTLACADALGVQVWLADSVTELATRIQELEELRKHATSHMSEYEAMHALMG